MIDLGRGEAIVIVPGLQGRWDWQRPAVEALARRNRVVAISLCDEPGSGFPFDPALGFENYVAQVGAAMDLASLDRATLVGVSYGGLIVAEFAARYPERVSRIVMASALSVPWSPDARARFYLRAPRLLFPLFAVTAPFRMAPEIHAAMPGFGRKLAFAMHSAKKFVGIGASPSRMARRLRLIEGHRFADHSRIAAPMLVITGEPELDRVVPVAVTKRYLNHHPAAQHVMLPRTGHLGVITKPELFADTVSSFVSANAHLRRAEASASADQSAGIAAPHTAEAEASALLANAERRVS